MWCLFSNFEEQLLWGESHLLGCDRHNLTCDIKFYFSKYTNLINGGPFL